MQIFSLCHLCLWYAWPARAQSSWPSSRLVWCAITVVHRLLATQLVVYWLSAPTLLSHTSRYIYAEMRVNLVFIGPKYTIIYLSAQLPCNADVVHAAIAYRLCCLDFDVYDHSTVLGASAPSQGTPPHNARWLWCCRIALYKRHNTAVRMYWCEVQ